MKIERELHEISTFRELPRWEPGSAEVDRDTSEKWANLRKAKRLLLELHEHEWGE